MSRKEEGAFTPAQSEVEEAGVSKADHIARIWKQTKVMFVLVEVVAACITLSAVADCIFHLGWGYDWTAVLAGFAIMAWGGVVYLASVAIFRWTTSIYK